MNTFNATRPGPDLYVIHAVAEKDDAEDDWLHDIAYENAVMRP